MPSPKSARSTVDVLAVAPHPDDAEIGCAGTLALMAEAGHRTGILNLTRGELGTRGTPALRSAEAELAASALGVSELCCLDFGDGGMRTGRDEEDQLIEVLRELRPTLVLAPPKVDRHPDHERANDLVRSACFYSGLLKRPGRLGADGSTLSAHRPALVLEYMLHDSFEPTIVIDVTSVWEKKLDALEAYASQLTTTPKGGAAPGASGTRTKVSSKEFFSALIGRARHYGQLIGAEFGEPYRAERPLAVRDLMALVPKGKLH